MSTKNVTVKGMTIIVTREAKEATMAMTGKKHITIVLGTKTSHTMWRKSTVALAPNIRVADTIVVALQAAATFQAAAALVLVLCQITASKVMLITMWRIPTWTWMKERAKPKTKGKDNKDVGFGSFYKQQPFNYSKKDFLAEQGHRNHICTADCTETDKAERDQANNDSGCKSD
eukprot:13012851-Ditylum_brightwellii.AAC.1